MPVFNDFDNKNIDTCVADLPRVCLQGADFVRHSDLARFLGVSVERMQIMLLRFVLRLPEGYEDSVVVQGDAILVGECWL